MSMSCARAVSCFGFCQKVGRGKSVKLLFTLLMCAVCCVPCTFSCACVSGLIFSFGGWGRFRLKN